ncbi:MAG: YicC/YloC family endoribonuclease [Brachymonas denitrificans]|uniref:YicC/YloC family endoribonuclease n=1 Tax=Brachymonas denitrificans TaxID=28220 RepID=UPI001BCD943C|nr:YicC/YloC family endoribonuclease [Brachymonas denitrificans]
MPVYSMTGYASLQSTPGQMQADANQGFDPALPDDWRLSLELRAVNSRFLDLTFKLPEELRPHEAALRELLQKQLRRGKVELRASLEHQSSAPDQMQAPSVALLQRLAAAQDAVRSWLPQAAPLSVADVLRLNTAPSSLALPPEQMQQWLLQSMRTLLERFQHARETEGRQLADSLLQRVQGLRALAREAEPLIPQLVEQQRQRFLDKWNDAFQQASAQSTANPVSAEAAQERALSEATAFAIRIDVAEEITRLQSHLDTIENLLNKGGELGKRMEFLIQELHREANTLGSKSAALDTSRISVDMKVLIEQMREQVQNIE